jgi:hypothetical protein
LKTEIRKHFYNLNNRDDAEKAEEYVESLNQLASDADQVYFENGYIKILVNQLCVKIRFKKTFEILYIEWETEKRNRHGNQ